MWKVSLFMCLTSISIYIDYWISFMKFGAKKSHKMMSYNLSRIASSSEWEHGMSTKPWYLAQMTLIGIYNKSYEGFMLSKCPENASMDQKG